MFYFLKDWLDTLRHVRDWFFKPKPRWMDPYEELRDPQVGKLPMPTVERRKSRLETRAAYRKPKGRSPSDELDFT